MSFFRFKIRFAILSVLALTAWGCSGPWLPTFNRTRALPTAKPVSYDTSAVNAPVAPITPIATVTEPEAITEAEPDLAGVLDKLQQIREIDPAAEQKLLEELRRTPSKSWPLVAEQFRASLAYHQKLASKTPPLREGTVAEDALMLQRRKSALAKKPDESQSAALDGKPSTAIGALVDPRKYETDGISSEQLATTLNAMPGTQPQPIETAPAEFIASETPQPLPIGSQHQANDAQSALPISKARLDSAVLQTSLEKKTAEGESASSSPPHDWQALVNQAAAELSQRVAAEPLSTAEVHQHASLRILWLLTGDTEKALAPIPRISPTEQDYWSRQLFALATYLDHHTIPDDKRRAAASVTHLEESLTSMRELGSLNLRNLTFCKSVYGYGAIEPFKMDDFSPGQKVSLYLEIENYHSESTAQGFCTLLGSTYEILDENGARINDGEFPDVDDCCRSRRRDFHIHYGLTLPENMKPGRYQLQLVVKDRQSEKLGNATVAFAIRGAQTGSSN